MARYVLKTLTGALPTLLILLLIVSMLTKFVRGDAVDFLLNQVGGGSGATTAQAQKLRQQLGLTRSVPEQYVAFLGNITNGTLGHSLYSSDTVRSIIFKQAFPTIELTFLAIIGSSVLGVFTGVVSSLRRNSKTDYVLRLFVNTFLGIPNFVLATAVLLLPAYYWGWSPPLHYVPLFQNPVQNLLFFALPVLTLAVGLAAFVARLTRTSTLEVIKTDYVRTARAKGLTEWTVIYGHVLKNSLMPVLTIIGIQIAFLLSGVIIIEQVFSIPGLGTLMLQSINQRDWPVVQGLTLISGVVVVVVNMIVEILYAYLDPRLRSA